MKTQRDFFIESFKAEKPTFIKVMNAVPGDKADYRPHPRSSSAAAIVWLLATELHDAVDLIERGECNYKATTPPSVAEAIAAYKKVADDLEGRVQKLDDAAWEKKVTLKMDGNPIWEAPLGDMLFGFLFDAVHHRGQLSSYLRPMGAKVPSIYGPSADDPGGPAA